MGQSAAILSQSIIMLCVASGCAARPADQPFITYEPFTGFRAVAIAEPKSTAPEKNPFKPSRNLAPPAEEVEIAAEEAEPRAQTVAAAEPAEPDDTDPRLLAFDASTRKLVEEELEDATPSERDELLDDLEGVDSGMVRQVLKIRRMMARSLEQLEAGHVQVSQVDFQDRPELRSEAGYTGPGQTFDHARETYRPTQPSHDSTPLLAMADGYTYPGHQPQTPPASTNAAGPPPANNPQLMAQNPYPTPRPTERTYDIRPGNEPPPAGYGHSGTMQPPQQNGYGYNVQPAAQPGYTNGGYPPATNQLPPGNRQLPLNAVGSTQNSPGMGQPFRGQPAVSPAGPNSAASISAVPNTGQPANSQPTSAFGSAMGTLGSAYSAVMSNFPRRDTQQLQGASLSNVLQPAGPADAAGNQLMTSGYSPTSYSAPPDFGHELNQMIDIAASDAARIPPGATREQQQQYIQKQVQLRMLYLMAGHQERALEAIPGIDPADQEFWQQVFWSLANYFDSDAMPDSSDRATQTIAQLRSAVQRLQESARLEIRNVNFCHKINSYGDYERFQRDEFTPGQPVLVYAEVENFKSDPTSDGRFRTLLRSTVDIHKAGDGGLVQSIPFQATEDLCRNHRRDYFHSYEFTIPQRISLGPHVMKLTMEDQLSRKVATYSLNFTVR